MRRIFRKRQLQLREDMMSGLFLGLLGLTLLVSGCAQVPSPPPAPLVVTKMVYVPWVFPPDLISVPSDPPVRPWVMQSDAAHYIVALKGVADSCRLIHAASVAAAAIPPPAK